MKEKKEMIPALKREVQMAKEALEDLHSLDKLKEKLQQLRKKRTWVWSRGAILLALN